MIVTFSVGNYRSFLEEQTLSLVASRRLSGSHDNHAIQIPGSDEKVLRTAVVYGANGAGKSNLFKALRYLKQIALKPKNKGRGTGRIRFRFEGQREDASTFDLQFLTNDRLYRFGVEVDDDAILKEWLVEVVGAREKVLYERSTSDGVVAISAPTLLKNASEKLRALVTVGGPQNQTFLATIAATLDPSDVGEEIHSILHWFTSDLQLIAPDSPYGALGHILTNDAEFLRFAGEFLKSSSTGVDHLEADKKEISESDLKALLPAQLVSKIFTDLQEDDEAIAVVPLTESTELLIERKDESHFYRISIQAAHAQDGKGQTLLPLGQESDGTRRLLNLLPALHHLRTSSAVYFIDEIDRSLHPILVWNFLKFFSDSCTGGQRQILVTTHESNLLDLELLRRDEIWFAEKNSAGATQMYSLADFKVRKDLEIRKHYLQGRFGAVPYLGTLERLIADKSCAE